MTHPKRIHRRNVHKGRNRGLATRGSQLAFGSFGLKTLESAWLTEKQIDAMRVIISRETKRQANIWIRVFPDKPVTKKPSEVRMGKGKGNFDRWVAPIRPGKILAEIEGVSKEIAQNVFRLATHKLPVKTKMITRRDYTEQK